MIFTKQIVVILIFAGIVICDRPVRSPIVTKTAKQFNGEPTDDLYGTTLTGGKITESKASGSSSSSNSENSQFNFDTKSATSEFGKIGTLGGISAGNQNDFINGLFASGSASSASGSGSSSSANSQNSNFDRQSATSEFGQIGSLSGISAGTQDGLINGLFSSSSGSADSLGQDSKFSLVTGHHTAVTTNGNNDGIHFDDKGSSNTDSSLSIGQAETSDGGTDSSEEFIGTDTGEIRRKKKPNKGSSGSSGGSWSSSSGSSGHGSSSSGHGSSGNQGSWDKYGSSGSSGHHGSWGGSAGSSGHGSSSGGHGSSGNHGSWDKYGSSGSSGHHGSWGGSGGSSGHGSSSSGHGSSGNHGSWDKYGSSGSSGHHGSWGGSGGSSGHGSSSGGHGSSGNHGSWDKYGSSGSSGHHGSWGGSGGSSSGNHGSWESHGSSGHGSSGNHGSWGGSSGHGDKYDKYGSYDDWSRHHNDEDSKDESYGISSRFSNDSSDSHGLVSTKCLNCMCSSFDDCIKSTHSCSSEFCGLFKITQPYWIDGGKCTVHGEEADHPHAYENCAKNIDCTMRTVQGYMKRFKEDCNQDGHIDCIDFAIIHKHGGYGCYLHRLEESLHNKLKLCTAHHTAGSFDSSHHILGSSGSHGSTGHSSGHSHATDDSLSLHNALDSSHTSSGDKHASGQYHSSNTDLAHISSGHQHDTDHKSGLIFHDIVSSQCLNCMCASFKECSKPVGTCRAGFCGLFEITKPYWIDGGKCTVHGEDSNSANAYENCSKDIGCVVRSVQGYMKHYKQDCNNDGYIDCLDFAIIHKFGGYGCPTSRLEESINNAIKVCSSHRSGTYY